MAPLVQSIVKARQKWNEKCKIRCVFVSILCFVCMCFLTFNYHAHMTQVPRDKSKKGGIKKRVYFWAGLSWFGKTPGFAWTAVDIKVIFRHTKNLCFDTVFLDEDDDGNPCVFRVVQTRAAGDDNYVSYVPHFEFPDSTPPEAEWSYSKHSEVKE